MSEGTIFTFYSYKGGVGRTFALANIGALLSVWGYKTLCVDWDLEAPGLHSYFKPWMSKENSPGLTELIQDYVDSKNPNWLDYTTEVHLPNTKQPLLLMQAGFQDTSYVQRMQALDWKKLYESHNLGNFLEELRWNWKEKLDFVLIDSRTGISDIGGICTIQLPDLLVLLFTANDQSLYGCVNIVERARQARANLPVDQSRLLVLPIAARFEGRVEFKLAEEWLKIFEDVLTPFYSEWAHRDTTVSDLLNFTRIPYISYWSFGEKLPVIEKGTKDPDDIGFPLETLTALIAHQLTHSDLLIRNRDMFVTTAKREPIESAFSKPIENTFNEPNYQDVTEGRLPIRIFISYSHHDLRLYKKLIGHLSILERQGTIRILTDAAIEAGSEWNATIYHQLEEANIILLLISADYLASDFLYSIEMRRALERHDARQARVVPIILRSVLWQQSPLGKLQALPQGGRAVTSPGWYNIDEAMTRITTEILYIIEDILKDF